MSQPELVYTFNQRTVQDFANQLKARQLDLQPSFQRRSVWRPRDREKFLSTVLENWPVPAVFLYEDESNDRITYKVIDGKQRLESVLIFMRAMRGEVFAARHRARDRGVTWSDLQRQKDTSRIRAYKFNVIVVSGDPNGVFELFVRINSTGKPLTRQECRHALLNSSEVLKSAAALFKEFGPYLARIGTISPSQAQRMRGEEFMCELILAAHEEGVLDKKKMLDPLMEPDRLGRSEVRDAARRVQDAIKYIQKYFPKLAETRLHRISDFYSLVFLLIELKRGGFIIENATRAKQAWHVLSALAAGVDSAGNPSSGERAPQDCREYLATVKEGTDAKAKRKQRHQILSNVLSSIFAQKDAVRSFSPAQRRLIWHNEGQMCSICGKRIASWDDFSVDHVKPHSRGGATSMSNAKPAHRLCNSRKGARSARAPRAKR